MWPGGRAQLAQDGRDGTIRRMAENQSELVDVETGSVPLEETHKAYGTELGRGFRVAHKQPSPAFTPRGPVSRQETEERLARELAEGATLPQGAGRRARPEEPDPWRDCFQRDLDRIKHSTAFRRLAHKCQVFVAPDNDHLRNRLTHAIEVAQFGRAVARTLRLNETLTETIALGHDCGHGPAGHASEEAFSPYMPSGVYDHAVYGANVTLAHLNLCEETLDGIRNHSWKLAAPSTPEGDIVSWADRIAYVCHDFDDAQRAGIVVASDLPAEVRSVVGVTQSRQLNRFFQLIVEASMREGRIGMDEEGAAALDAFRKFNYERIYLRPESRKQAEKVINLIRGLVDYYAERPWMVEGISPMPQPNSPAAVAAAVKHVSGMSDRYAFSEAVELLGWDPNKLPRGV